MFRDEYFDMTNNYYKLLRVPESATKAEIRRSYLRLAKENHPDVGGSTAKMQQLNTAYEILSNALSRQEYDRKLAAQAAKETTARQASNMRSQNSQSVNKYARSSRPVDDIRKAPSTPRSERKAASSRPVRRTYGEAKPRQCTNIFNRIFGVAAGMAIFAMLALTFGNAGMKAASSIADAIVGNKNTASAQDGNNASGSAGSNQTVAASNTSIDNSQNLTGTSDVDSTTSASNSTAATTDTTANTDTSSSADENATQPSATASQTGINDKVCRKGQLYKGRCYLSGVNRTSF